jgi:hypothetical protein
MSVAQFMRHIFLNGEYSDIKVSALGLVWDLHRVHLGQSGYFREILGNPRWLESNQDCIKIDIDEDGISVEALWMTLASMYYDVDITTDNLAGAWPRLRDFLLTEWLGAVPQ